MRYALTVPACLVLIPLLCGGGCGDGNDGPSDADGEEINLDGTDEIAPADAGDAAATCSDLVSIMSDCYESLAGYRPDEDLLADWAAGCGRDIDAAACYACFEGLSCDQMAEPHSCMEGCTGFKPLACLQLVEFTADCVVEVIGRGPSRADMATWFERCTADNHSTECLLCVMDDASCQDYLTNPMMVYDTTCADVCP